MPSLYCSPIITFSQENSQFVFRCFLDASITVGQTIIWLLPVTTSPSRSCPQLIRGCLFGKPLFTPILRISRNVRYQPLGRAVSGLRTFPSDRIFQEVWKGPYFLQSPSSKETGELYRNTCFFPEWLLQLRKSPEIF